MCEFVLRLLFGFCFILGLDLYFGFWFLVVFFFFFFNGTKVQSQNYHKCLFSKNKTSLKPCLSLLIYIPAISTSHGSVLEMQSIRSPCKDCSKTVTQGNQKEKNEIEIFKRHKNSGGKQSKVSFSTWFPLLHSSNFHPSPPPLPTDSSAVKGRKIVKSIPKLKTSSEGSSLLPILTSLFSFHIPSCSIFLLLISHISINEKSPALLTPLCLQLTRNL